MRFLLLLPLCGWFLFSAGQTTGEFVRLGVNEGLSQNSVYAIHQDEQGFLWIGTGDGLNRFDGKAIKIYREKWGDTSSLNLPGRIVTSAIIQDGAQRLWFKTDKGLVGLDKKTDRFIQPSLYNPSIKAWEKDVKPIGIDPLGQLWFFDKWNFRVVNPSTWQVKTIQTGAAQIGDAFIEGDRIYFTTTSGFYLYGTNSGALQQLRGESGIKALTCIGRAKYALHTKNDIWIFHSRSGRFEQLDLFPGAYSPSTKAAVLLFSEFPANVYYLRSVANGLVRYDAKSGIRQSFLHEPGNPSSLSNNYITTTYKDRSNNLWIGTEGGGLSRMDLKPQKFKSFPSYTVNAGQAANLMVKSIATTSGKILVGTFSQGLFVVDPEGKKFRKFTFSQSFKMPTPSINVLQYDGAGRLWMNLGNAIGYLDTNTLRFREHQLLKPVKGLPEYSCWIYSMLEYAPGEFLLGTYYGLYRMRVKNGKVVTSMVPADSLLNGHILSIQKAPDGSIYIGKSGNGFWRIRLAERGFEVIDRGFLTTGIRHFHFDAKRPLVWMASESGLIVYNVQTGRHQIYDDENGLSNSYIYSILPQNDSTLWVSTNKGINKAVVRFQPGGMVEGITFTGYTQVDGLQSNEFNTGAFYRSAEGEMFFGGVNGINWFRGSHIITNHHRPSVVLTTLKVNEREFSSPTAIPYLKSITLPYDQNTISLRFASLEYTNANANLYAYQLDGVDKDWIHSGTTNEARYANLPPGIYHFKVRGTNSDGIWNETPSDFRIEITPPYWQTATFRLLVVMASLLLLGFLIRFYVTIRVRNKIKELEKQKAINEERLRISRDMHDELGTGLTKIALLSEVTRQQFTTTESSTLGEITATSRQLTQKMGEIIWTLNPQNDTLDNLAAYLKEQLYELSEAAGLDLVTRYPGQVPAVAVSNRQRQQVLLVTKEGFNNIIRHAKARLVSFTLEIGDEVVFTLEDDGVGYDPGPSLESSNGKGNGLRNMAWRMEQIGGSFWFGRKEEGGSILKYRFPLKT